MPRSALTSTYILNTYAVIYTKTRNTDTLQLYINVIVNQRHSAIIHKYFSQPSALSKACGGDKTATAGKFHTKIQKNDKYSHGERDHNRENTTNLRLHLNSCTIMHVCVK